MSRKTRAELLRRRHLYRRLILRGKAALPPRCAARLIGPDCAYHLYRQLGCEPAGEPDRDERER